MAGWWIVGTTVATAASAWYARHSRPLPWRAPAVGAWGVLVSEVMLQQTPVHRVAPVWSIWMRRWPVPAALAHSGGGEAVRAWGRLGYPRRALRLFECADLITNRHAGQVPDTLPGLLALPGVGGYTARAVAAFAFGHRVPVVDTNVRRVVARLGGRPDAGPTTTAADLLATEALLPVRPADAVRASAALMELGALVCTARAPRCGSCPVRRHCAWSQAGRPEAGQPVRRSQRYAGTDRQVRGLLLEVLRCADGPVPAASLDLTWLDAVQRHRALAGLLADGLVSRTTGDRYLLGGGQPPQD